MEVTGKIKSIGETQTFGTNGFQKREVVITTVEQYPQHILVEFVQDKCAIVDKYKAGQSVKIGINLRGREWINQQGETKYFNSIQGWKIESDLEAAAEVIDAVFEPLDGASLAIVEDDLPF